jgi:hypothetical protein
MKSILVPAAVFLLVIGAAMSEFVAHVASVERVDAIAPLALPGSLERSDEAGPEVKLLLLALLPEGFDNKEMQLEPGEYLLIIGNRTGLRDVNVRFDRQGNERIGAGVVDGRQRNWKKRLKLSTGSYVVTANDNPDWTCRIVVAR